jgi:hypothetical protein
MLCNICSKINLDEQVSEEGMKHHKNFMDLYNAARDGCHLCEAVAEDHYANYHDYEEDDDEESDSGFTDLDAERAQIVCKVDFGYPSSAVVKFRKLRWSGVRHPLKVSLGCARRQVS